MPLPDKEFTADEMTQVLQEGLKEFQEKVVGRMLPVLDMPPNAPQPILTSEVRHERQSRGDRSLYAGKNPTMNEAESSDLPWMEFEAAVAGATATVSIPATYV